MKIETVSAAAGAALGTKSGVQALWASILAAPFIASGEASYIPVVAIAGLLGGFARWVADGQSIWPQGLSTIFLGMVTAVFLWPAGKSLTETATGHLDMGPFESLMFGGFVSGLMGVTLIGFIIDVARIRKARLTDDKS